MAEQKLYQMILVCALWSICYCNVLEEPAVERDEIEVQNQIFSAILKRMETLEAQNARMKAELEKLKELQMARTNTVTYIKGDGDNETGPQGLPGPPGPPGSPGVPGTQGLRGIDGRDGRDGINGINGRDGEDGANGQPGAPGEPGKDGVSGLQGPGGDTGPQGLTRGGAVYTRWGRTTCGANSSLIYAGFTGKKERGQKGGGVNYQCMPWNPEHHNYISGMTWAGTIVGVEYETYNKGILGYDSDDQGAPCAVCFADNRLSLLVIPAKRNCPSAWHKEYEGYLMSEEYNSDNPSTFECVSENPEYVPGEAVDRTAAGFFFNKVVCSKGVPCPPYLAEGAITCVVCTM